MTGIAAARTTSPTRTGAIPGDNQPNTNNNRYGLGRTYRPGTSNNYQSDDND